MDNLLLLCLSNAVAVVVLALLAAAAGFFLRRRPALVHALWLLVLLKLFTPPLVRLPAPWSTDGPTRRVDPASEPPVSSPVETRELDVVTALPPLPEDNPLHEAEGAPPEFAGLPEPRIVVEVVPPMVDEESTADLPAATPPEAAPVDALPGWSATVAAVWVAGTLGWFLLAAVRVLRFRRLLRYATPAPVDLRERARRLADRLGLARCPGVWLVPGRLSPMLWAAGGAPRLLVPAGLLCQVRDEQLDTLLVHELAHLCRRDHWVRGLELLAMGLYWWHPVVWWARRELREAEEQCCDAWVVSVLSGARRSYAEALVETLDFLSQAPAAPPLLASGIGHVADLKRRLTMILSGTTPRALSWRGVLAMLGLTALLPLVPGWVRAQPPDNEKKVIELRLDDLRREGVVPVAADPKANAEIEKLVSELKKKQAEVQDLEAKIRAVKARAAKPDTKSGAVDDKIVRLWDVADGKRVFILRDGSKDPAKPGTAPHGTLYELVPGEKGTLILRPVGPNMVPPMPQPVLPPGVKIEGFQPFLGTPPVPVRPGDPAPYVEKKVVERRTQDLEKRLDEIMRELEQLRKDMKANPKINVPQPVRPGTGTEKRPDERRKNEPPEAALEEYLQKAETKAAQIRAYRKNLDEKFVEQLVPLRVARSKMEEELKAIEKKLEAAQATALDSEKRHKTILLTLDPTSDEAVRVLKKAEAQLETTLQQVEEVRRVRLSLVEQGEKAKLRLEALERDRAATLEQLEEARKEAEAATNRARKALEEAPKP